VGGRGREGKKLKGGIVSRARLESLPHDTKGGGRDMSTLL